MLSFGLCSPILAVAVACTVVCRMNVLMLLIGRFTNVLKCDVDDDVKESVHYALVALGKIHFPLTEVLKQSFWAMVWTSAFFFSLVCWDIAGDEVGWRESVWIPIVTISYPLLFWLIALCVNHRDAKLQRREDYDDEKMENMRDTDLELPSLQSVDASCSSTRSTVTDNPIQPTFNDSTSTSAGWPSIAVHAISSPSTLSR